MIVTIDTCLLPLAVEHDWRPAPSATQVQAHAARATIGNLAITPEPSDDWRTAPKQPLGLWLARCTDDWPYGRDFQAAYGLHKPRVTLHVMMLCEHEGVVYWGAPGASIRLDRSRWLTTAVWRPIDIEGDAMPWPETSS